MSISEISAAELAAVSRRERPILFKGEMVRAIQEGRKTQTRRIIKDQPCNAGKPFEGAVYDDTVEWCWFYSGEWKGKSVQVKSTILGMCPHGRVGDLLWVRETGAYKYMNGIGFHYVYRADGEQDKRWLEDGKWQPSIFMKREHSRLTLEILDVRVQRLQDITEEDAIAEGIEEQDGKYLIYCDNIQAGWRAGEWTRYPIVSFRSLWESINGAASWDANPWVFVVSFKKLEGIVSQELRP